jgi:hypothetical protein
MQADDPNDYIHVDEARSILRVTARQVQRHAAKGRVRSRRVGRRLELHRADIEALAEELGAEDRPALVHEGELLADSGAMLDYLREKDQQILFLSRRVGELEGQAHNQLLPAGEALLRQELAEAQARTKTLEAENSRLRRSWWARLFRR